MGFDSDDRELDDWAVRLIRRKASQLIGRYGLVEADRQDVIQNLSVDLWSRLEKFDPERASRHTFAARVIEHGAARLVEHRTAPIRDCRRYAWSLDEWREGEDGDRMRRGELIDQDSYFASIGQPTLPLAELAALRADLRRLFEGLTPDLRDLWLRLADGQTLTEISRDTGVTRGTLYDRLGRLRNVAEAAGLRSLLER